MNVLSLFDGMACGRLALEKAGIKVDNYYASEIDKYAMQIAKKNWPDIIHIGDVQKVKGADLPKIDLLIGGSPCQGFSFAGKQLNFDDPRSKLFFDFVRLKDECKPKYFLLENVKMKKESQQIITDFLGVDPVEINSALVSAQNRRRLYWSNLPIEQPKNKGIMLADILQYDEVGIIKSYGKFELRNEKAMCLDANYHKGLDNHGQRTGVWKLIGYANGYIKGPYALTEKRTEEAKRIRKESIKNNGKDYSPRRAKELVPRTDGKMNCLTATYSMKEHIVVENKLEFKNAPYNSKFKQDNTTSTKAEKHPTLLARSFGKTSGIGIHDESQYWRKLTPVECERLQTVPDNYTEGVSNTQRYKMIGNGWTIDVIAHIFSKLKNKDLILKTPYKQATLF